MVLNEAMMFDAGCVCVCVLALGTGLLVSDEP